MRIIFWPILFEFLVKCCFAILKYHFCIFGIINHTLLASSFTFMHLHFYCKYLNKLNFMYFIKMQIRCIYPFLYLDRYWILRIICKYSLLWTSEHEEILTVCIWSVWGILTLGHLPLVNRFVSVVEGPLRYFKTIRRKKCSIYLASSIKENIDFFISVYVVHMASFYAS